MANVFDQINPAVEGTPDVATAPVAEKDSKKDAERKARIQAMKDSLHQTLQNDPTFTQRLHSLSNSLEVVNSLGYGDSGNIIVDRDKSTDGNRALTTTSVIVGYRVRNTGDKPINYQTEAWTKDESGKYVAQKVEKVLAPGSTADLNRQYMTMLCAIPEISFQLSNGKVIRGSGKMGNGDLKTELEAYYFSFNKSEDKQINSDEVKLNVGVKGGDGKWTVKPEFAETFGYLENVAEKAARARKPAGEKLNASDLAANFVMQMIENSKM